MEIKRLLKKPFWMLTSVLSALFIINLILTLSPAALQWAITRTYHIVDIKPDSGYSYRFDLPVLAETAASDVQLYEDGVLLEKMPGELLFIVARDGAGRFGRGEEERQIFKVFFAATDNSDPRLNGRDYTLQYKFPILSQKRMIALLMLNLAVLGVLIAWRQMGVERWFAIKASLDRFEDAFLWGVRFFLLANFIVLLVLLIRPIHSLQFMFTTNFILYAGFVVWLSFHRATILDRIISLGLVCGLFAASLVAIWQFEGTPVEGVSSVGGLLPYSDANGYWKDMMRLIAGNRVTYSVMFKRIVPTAAGAVLFRLSGENLQLTLFELAMLWGISTWLVGAEVRRSIGRAAAALVVLLGWNYFNIYPFAGTLLSENLAYILGAGGAAVLLSGLHRQSPWVMGLGALLISHAISSRTGAIFVTPIVILWAALNLEIKYRIRFLVGLAAIIILLNLYVGALGTMFGTVEVNSASNANYYSLVSLVWGRITGNDFLKLYTLYPEMNFMDYGAQTSFVAMLIKEMIFARPVILLEFAIGNILTMLSPGNTTLSLFFHHHVLNFAAHCFLIIGLLVSLLKWRKPQYSLALFSFIGILISSPALVLTFHRPVAPVYLFAALVVGAGLQSFLNFWKRWVNKPNDRSTEPERVNWAAVYGAGILAFTLLMPLTLKLNSHQEAGMFPTIGDCSDNANQAILVEAPHRGSYIHLVDEDSSEVYNIQRAPEITPSLFRSRLDGINAEESDMFSNYAVNGTVVFGDPNYNFVITPDNILEMEGRVQLCGFPEGSSFIVTENLPDSGIQEN